MVAVMRASFGLGVSVSPNVYGDPWFTPPQDETRRYS